jgi:hypothetical protein
MKGSSIMPAVTIEIPETLSLQLGPYRDNLGDLLWIGLNEVCKEQALALFRKGNISLWKAARLAGVSLQEMVQYAAAQGLRAKVDEETIREELV